MIQGFILDGTPLLKFWVYLGAAILIQGISKSGFAGGAGIVSVPLMLLVMPADKTMAVLLPLLVLCDFNAIYHHRHNKIWSSVMQIYLPSIIGIVIGAAVWWKIGREGVEDYKADIKRFVGVIAILFAIYIIVKETAMDWVARFKPGWRAGVFSGIASGFCSTIAHAAGPIVSLHVFAQGMSKTMFVGTVAWTFTLINLTKMPFYIGTGLIRKDVLVFDLFLIWLIPIGSYLGKWMHHRVSDRIFNWVIMVFTLALGIQLVIGH